MECASLPFLLLLRKAYKQSSKPWYCKPKRSLLCAQGYEQACTTPPLLDWPKSLILGLEIHQSLKWPSTGGQGCRTGGLICSCHKLSLFFEWVISLVRLNSLFGLPLSSGSGLWFTPELMSATSGGNNLSLDPAAVKLEELWGLGVTVPHSLWRIRTWGWGHGDSGVTVLWEPSLDTPSLMLSAHWLLVERRFQGYRSVSKSNFYRIHFY